MPDDTAQSSIARTLEWIKESGLLAVTVVGLLIYFFLSIPATLFYSRLGTNPGEVGLNYVSLLSSSTFELLVIFVILASAILVGAFALMYFSMLVYTLVAFPEMMLSRGSRPDQDRFGRVLDSNLKIYKRIPEFFEGRKVFRPDFPKSLAEWETVVQRRDELLKIQDLTPEQSAEVTDIESRLKRPKAPKAAFLDAYIEPFIVIFLGTRHRIRRLAVPLALVIMIVLLPALAFVQAGQILDGHTYFASNAGVFDYHADPVSVYPALPNAVAEIRDLQAKKLFLLGQNAQYAVLYSPMDHSTIRVPITAVIIISVRG